MAAFDLESIIKEGVEKVLNKPIVDGKSVVDWAKIGIKAPRWISVKDRLPEESKKVLVYCKNGCMISVFFSHRWKAFNHFDSQGDPTEGENHCFLDATHWMSLPEPLEEENENE